MTAMTQQEPIPIACTLQPGEESRAASERYRALFADAYVGGERTSSGVRWTFRNDEGIESRVQDLVAMEQRCCSFMRMSVTVSGGEITWELSGTEEARPFFDEYFQLLALGLSTGCVCAPAGGEGEN